MDQVKKYLPFLIFFLGVSILVLAIFLFKKKPTDINQTVVGEEETVSEIPFNDRPFTSLIPSKDGHWLKLKVGDIKVKASSLDYEILYQLPDGRTQGVPGTIKIAENGFERDILLGSESSGKKRYDEGVKGGTLTLKFRDEKGKLVGKLSTPFTLLSETKEIISSDGKFSYILDNVPKNIYFVVMETFGVEVLPGFEVALGPYGIFASDGSQVKGVIKSSDDSLDLYQLKEGSWTKIDSGKDISPGIFVFSKGSTSN